MEQLVERLLERWRATGVILNPGADPKILSNFENEHGVRLPMDLRFFLLGANGMAENYCDELTTIFPLQNYSVIATKLSESPKLSDAQHYFCFGDYNFGGSFYGIRLSAQLGDPTPVRVFWSDGDGWQCGENFEQFISKYLEEGPHSMF